MAVAYVDTSYVVAIAFQDKAAASLARKLDSYENLLAANLLEAELRSVFSREKADAEPGILAGLSWIVPDRPLTDEIAAVLKAGYVRGADCWHLATALYASGDPAGMHFLTLDSRQRAVASALGFKT
jgi:predicted nucleic acid-binding protein